MRRIALIATVLAALAGGLATVAGADDTHTYKLEMYDAFGLVEGAEVKVAGVTAGKITEFEVNEQKRALITVELTGPLAVLGEETDCKSEPQSLIAEYFIDCQPAGPALPDGATVPKLVTQTVQNDLVANTLRLPYRQRLSLLINEFGTALAGNPENLNEAIRMGAPALQDLHEALKLLADQSRTITQLNVDSDEIVGRLNDRSADVVRFIREAGDAAEASAARRDDLSTDFDLLDDALAELGPTMAELENVAVESTPLLADLRRAAPGLNTLAQRLPAFARASERSLTTLGNAAGPGTRALRRGRDEIQALADAAVPAKPVAKQARVFLDDIADPRRAVQFDARAGVDTGRSNPEPGQPDTEGYTGMEGLLNFFYILALGTNQYDEAGHTTHISLRSVEGECGPYNAGEDWPLDQRFTHNPAIDQAPADRTIVPERAHPCVGVMGRNQPGITPGFDEADLGIGRYNGLDFPGTAKNDSVCPGDGPGGDGVYSQAEAEDASNDLDLCDPRLGAEFPGTLRARASARGGEPGSRSSARGESGQPAPAADGDAAGSSPLPASPDEIREDLEEILDLPKNALGDVAAGLGAKKKSGKRKRKRNGGRGPGGEALGNLGRGATQEAEALLDFLFGP